MPGPVTNKRIKPSGRGKVLHQERVLHQLHGLRITPPTMRSHRCNDHEQKPEQGAVSGAKPSTNDMTITHSAVRAKKLIISGFT